VQCEEAKALFSDHLDGALTVEAEEALGAHLALCDACRRALLRYEQGLRALTGASPEPPAALDERIARAAVAEGLLHAAGRPGVRWLLPVAASLACFALGVAVARRGALSSPSQSPWPPRFAPTGAALSCVSVPDPQPWGDLDAFRQLPAKASAMTEVRARAFRVAVPRWLVSRGPYDTLASSAVESGAGVCVPLRAAYGDRLTLTVTPAPAAAESAGKEFAFESDPTRVLYGRVSWIHAGLIWSLEGRADAAELLDLAQELSARAGGDRT